MKHETGALERWRLGLLSLTLTKRITCHVDTWHERSSTDPAELPHSKCLQCLPPPTGPVKLSELI